MIIIKDLGTYSSFEELRIDICNVFVIDYNMYNSETVLVYFFIIIIYSLYLYACGGISKLFHIFQTITNIYIYITFHTSYCIKTYKDSNYTQQPVYNRVFTYLIIILFLKL